MMTTDSLAKNYTPVPDSQKDEPDVVQVEETRSGYIVHHVKQGDVFYNDRHSAYVSAAQGGKRFWLKKYQPE